MSRCQRRFKALNRCKSQSPTPRHVPPSTRSLLKCWEVEFVWYGLEMETAPQNAGTDGEIPVGTWDQRSGRDLFSLQGRHWVVCTAAGPKNSPTCPALPGEGTALTWVISYKKEFETHGKISEIWGWVEISAIFVWFYSRASSSWVFNARDIFFFNILFSESWTMCFPWGNFFKISFCFVLYLKCFS